MCIRRFAQQHSAPLELRNFAKPVDYKHFVPPGLLVMSSRVRPVALS